MDPHDNQHELIGDGFTRLSMSKAVWLLTATEL